MTFLITLLSVVVVAAGFAVLHYALTHKTAELRVAGWTLVIGGLMNIGGVFYFAPSHDAGYGSMGKSCCSGMMGGWESGKPKQCRGKEAKMHLDPPPPPPPAETAEPDADAKDKKPAK